MKDHLKNLKKWFREQPSWIQEAAHRLVSSGALSDSALDALLELCINPVSAPSKAADLNLEALGAPEGGESFHLDGISEVSGINALSPTRPLEFGDQPLCIIYGRNGAGKSGYVRLLKSACGARAAGEVLGNVFAPGTPTQSATITVTAGDETRGFKWAGGSIPDLCAVEIYDTACGLLYVDEENEVSYETPLLRLFSELTEACASVRERLDTKVSAETSAKPSLPNAHVGTGAATWYEGLTHKTSEKEIAANTEWNVAHEKKLQDLAKRLAETDPASKANALRKQADSVAALLNQMQGIEVGLCNEQFAALLKKRLLATSTRKAADEDAERVFSDAPLGGVGTESWRLLWEAARRYAEEEAYPDASFPSTKAGARCVLCQREFDESARARFRSFEEFVQGDLQKSATEAEADLETAIHALPDVPSEAVLDTKLEAAGISDNAQKRHVQEYVTSLAARKTSCLEAMTAKGIKELPPCEGIAFLEGLVSKLTEDAAVCDGDAEGQNRPALLKESGELAGRKWLSQQRAAVKAEVSRLQRLEALRIARERTDTTSLSTRKSLLADQIVTEA